MSNSEERHDAGADLRRFRLMNRREFLLYGSAAAASASTFSVSLLPGASRAADMSQLQAIGHPSKQALAALADTLYGSAADNSCVAAGYTYFGQFVAHDVSFTTVSGTGRSPGLDLDCLYGYERTDAPWYEVNSGRIALVTHNLQSRLPQKVFVDVPRSSGSPAMADARNDDNVILSQMHVLWAQFHNLVYDHHAGRRVPSRDAYARARKTVTACYQRIVRQDYLKTVCGEEAYEHALERLARNDIERRGAIPKEAAAAGFRLHPMVRSVYQINRGSQPTELTELLRAGGDRDVVRYPSKFLVDWRRLFAVPGESGVTMPARQFTPQLVPTFRRLPTADGEIDMARNMLARHRTERLVSGQQLAASYGVPRLTPAEMVRGAPPQQRDVLRQHPELIQATPLWYYLMLESLIKEDGQRLGPVASRLLCDTFFGFPEINQSDEDYPGTDIATMGGLVAFLQTQGAHLWTTNV